MEYKRATGHLQANLNNVEFRQVERLEKRVKDDRVTEYKYGVIFYTTFHIGSKSYPIKVRIFCWICFHIETYLHAVCFIVSIVMKLPMAIIIFSLVALCFSVTLSCLALYTTLLYKIKVWWLYPFGSKPDTILHFLNVLSLLIYAGKWKFSGMISQMTKSI